MKAIFKTNTIKIQITKAQAMFLRQVFDCQDRPIQYAGAIMFGQGGGWYEIAANLSEYDWATEDQARRVMLRKIRHVLQMEEAPQQKASRELDKTANFALRHGMSQEDFHKAFNIQGTVTGRTSSSGEEVFVELDRNRNGAYSMDLSVAAPTKLEGIEGTIHLPQRPRVAQPPVSQDRLQHLANVVNRRYGHTATK